MTRKPAKRDRGAQALTRAMQALEQGALAKAETEFMRALDADPDQIEVHFRLGTLLSKMLRMDEAEPHLRRVCAALPGEANAQHAHGVALSVLGRRDDAIAALQRAVALAPDHREAQADLAELRAHAGDGGMDKRALRRWPILMSELGDLRQAASQYVIENADEPAFRADNATRFFTLGSCFAENLAISLDKTGRNVDFFPYSEEINSTFANRYLIEWALGRLESEQLNGYFDRQFAGIGRAAFSERLALADVIIFTVGVAPCFFARDSGAFVLPRASNVSLWAQDNVFRTTSVGENRDNLLAIIALIREINPDCQIVLTVSPVPLKGTLEFASVVQADCISKSTLRVAVHEALAEQPAGVSYWPSYEIVRWLGGYFENTFGGDDGRSRHISRRVIDVIIELFIEHHG